MASKSTKASKASKASKAASAYKRFKFDREFRQQGAHVLAGIDEAGRGPLAGPVVAAAVVLPDKMPRGLNDLNDSKQILPQRREEMYDLITDCAEAWAVGIIDEKTIDEINILQATWRAMAEAARGLGCKCDLLLVDGNPVKGLPYKQHNVIKGDSKSASIAAASILAKVTRDRIMLRYHERFPQYGFDTHKGYRCRYHFSALEVFGPSPIHRYTFVPCQETLFHQWHQPTETFQSVWRSLLEACDPDDLEGRWRQHEPVKFTLPALEAEFLDLTRERRLKMLLNHNAPALTDGEESD